MTKRRAVIITVVILLLAAGVGATVRKKHADAGTPVAPGPNGLQVPVTLEFLASDVAQVSPHDLRQTLPLSGSLRAVNQAAVKAKVAGEVREVLVREGEPVSAGQVLVKMDSSEFQARLDQSQGALQAARGQLDIATKSRDNNKALLAKGFISQNAFDNASSQYEIARANVESAKGGLDVAQKSLGDTVIRAPIAGLISNRTIQPGEKVSADYRFFDVVDLRQMEMEAAVPTTDIMHVALGQEVQVKVEGLTKALIGKVVRINPATQSGSRSIMAYIQIDNPQAVLRAGMFGDALLTLAKKTGVLTVPPSAIQDNAGAPFVYAVEKERLVQKSVTLGIRGNDGDGSAIEIISGLDNGAQIVKSNLGNLRSGTQVRFAKAASDAAADVKAPVQR